MNTYAEYHAIPTVQLTQIQSDPDQCKAIIEGEWTTE